MLSEANRNMFCLMNKELFMSPYWLQHVRVMRASTEAGDCRQRRAGNW